MSERSFTGKVRKMRAELAEPATYALPLGDHDVAVNPLLGKVVRLEFAGQINCIHCDRKTSKSFNQGYCYPCFKRLARCDSCIVSPEKCHYAAGTCREPEWGEENCMIEHVVYLANTSGLKVGITRGTQVPTRWLDQGATQALPIFRAASRLLSGLVETSLAQHVADKTNWRAMLKGAAPELDLNAERDRLVEACSDPLAALTSAHGINAIQPVADTAALSIEYPVLAHPDKVTSFNLDKTPLVEGTLIGIKGQYLIFDTGVINMRKYGGYQLTLSTGE